MFGKKLKLIALAVCLLQTYTVRAAGLDGDDFGPVRPYNPMRGAAAALTLLGSIGLVFGLSDLGQECKLCCIVPSNDTLVNDTLKTVENCTTEAGPWYCDSFRDVYVDGQAYSGKLEQSYTYSCEYKPWAKYMFAFFPATVLGAISLVLFSAESFPLTETGSEGEQSSSSSLEVVFSETETPAT